MFQTHGEHERTRVTHVKTYSVGSGYSTPVAFTNQKEVTFGYVKTFTDNSLTTVSAPHYYHMGGNSRKAILVEHQYFGSWRMVNHHYFAEWIYWCHQFAKLVNHQYLTRERLGVSVLYPSLTMHGLPRAAANRHKSILLH